MDDRVKKDVATFSAGAGIALVGKIAGRGLHLAGQVVLARIFGPSGLGLYSLGWNSLRILGLIAPLGLEKGVIRFASVPSSNDEENEDTYEIILQCLFWSFISSVLIGAIIFLLSPALSAAFQKPDLIPIFRIVSFAFPFSSLLLIGASATSISQNVKYYIIAEEFVQPGVNLVLVLLFYWIGLGLWGAVFASSVSFFVASAVVLIFLWRLFPGLFTKMHKSIMINKGLLLYSFPSALSGMFSTLILLLDRVMIGYYRTEFETGIYQAISLYSVIFVTILSALKTIFSPMISELFNNSEWDRFHLLYKLCTKWGFYFGVPFLLILFFLPSEVILLFYGDEYIVGTFALLILMFGQIMNVITGPVDLMLIMSDHQKDWFWITGIGLLISIGLNSILIPIAGYAGAAISVSITLSLIFLAGLIRVKQIFNIWPYDGQFLKGLFVTAFTIAALSGINRLLIGMDPLFRILLFSVSSFGIFIFSLLVAGLDEMDRELLSLVRKRIITSR